MANLPATAFAYRLVEWHERRGSLTARAYRSLVEECRISGDRERLGRLINDMKAQKDAIREAAY